MRSSHKSNNFGNPDESTEPTEPSELHEAIKSTEPNTPSEPSEPTEPNTPSEPSEPTEPGGPPQPAENTDVNQPRGDDAVAQSEIEDMAEDTAVDRSPYDYFRSAAHGDADGENAGSTVLTSDYLWPEQRRAGERTVVLWWLLPVAVLGFVILGVGFLKSRPEGAELHMWMWTALLGVVGFGLVVGILLSRHGWRIDREKGRITIWWGVLLPLIQKKRNLDEYDRVVVRQDPKGGESAYLVELEAGQAEQNHTTDQTGRVRLSPRCCALSYPEGLLGAKRVAQFLNLPLADRCTRVEVVRPPDLLGESLIDRWKRINADRELAEVPRRFFNVYRKAGNSLMVGRKEPDGRVAWDVIVSADSLIVEGKKFDAVDLEELILDDQAYNRTDGTIVDGCYSGIHVFGSKDTAVFGCKLPPEETHFLYSVVRAVLLGVNLRTIKLPQS